MKYASMGYSGITPTPFFMISRITAIGFISIPAPTPRCIPDSTILRFRKPWLPYLSLFSPFLSQSILIKVYICFLLVKSLNNPPGSAKECLQFDILQ